MAGVRFHGNQDAITCAAATEITVAQIVAAANHRVLLHEVSIFFDGTTNTAEPVLVKIARQSTAGTMTSLTLVKSNDSDDETLQTTAQHTATAEPTTGNILYQYRVHPQTGNWWQAPFGQAIPIKGGGRIGILVTAAAEVDATVSFAGEE